MPGLEKWPSWVKLFELVLWETFQGCIFTNDSKGRVTPFMRLFTERQQELIRNWQITWIHVSSNRVGIIFFITRCLCVTALTWYIVICIDALAR